MSTLGQIIASIDNAKRVGKRNIQDLIDNPEAFLSMLQQRLENFNKDRVAEIRPEGAGLRKLSDREAVQRYTSGALDNIGGGGLGALGVIKAKGGNWLNGSVEDVLKPLKRGLIDNGEQMVARGLLTPEQVVRRPDVVLNNWIEGPLTRYVKRDMATEGDPVRRLAEQGVLHIDPINLTGGIVQTHPSGEFVQKLGKSDAAKRWENASDRLLQFDRVGNIPTDSKVYQRNPWLEKLKIESPSEEVYSANESFHLPRSVGFDHLIDELSNALNPESGLPRHLQLNLDDMKQMGMERAVRHVDAINKWRAAQKAEADALRANNAATVLYKEYPENNPKGLRWVELKAPSELPEGWQYREKSGNYIMPDGTVTGTGPQERALAEQLKYEGDTMGHCVGGYCDDVLSGRSRIFSLRDAKGEPHVTIETRPGQVNWSSEQYKWATENPEEYAAFREKYPDLTTQDREFRKMFKEKYAVPDSIIQIKGKQNRKPNDEYLPFVQDFVRSGKWSDVGDLENSGLMKNKFDEETLKRYGHEYQPYVNQEDLDAIMRAIDDKLEGYAQGGLVQSEDLPFHVMDGIITNYQP